MTAIPLASNFSAAYHDYRNIETFSPSILSGQEAMISMQNYGISPSYHSIQPAPTLGEIMNRGIEPFYSTPQPAPTMDQNKIYGIPSSYSTIQPAPTMDQIKNFGIPSSYNTIQPAPTADQIKNYGIPSSCNTIQPAPTTDQINNYGIQPSYNTIQSTPTMTQVENEPNSEIMHQYSNNDESINTACLITIQEVSIKRMSPKELEKKWYRQCDICNKVFLEWKNLLRHRRTHGPMECYRCSLCGNLYLTKKKLAKHYETHFAGTSLHSK